ERHPGTDRYLDSLKPLNVEGALDTYTHMGEIWGIIVAGYLASAKGLKMLKERRANLQQFSVGDFLNETLAVEAEAVASCSADDRVRLDQRLSDIKKRA